MARHHRRPNRWHGFVVGILGGAAGLLGMALYWRYVAPNLEEAAAGIVPAPDAEDEGQDEPGPLDDVSIPGPLYQGEESSTAALGRLVYQGVAGRPPRAKETRNLLSQLVHWGYGLLQGGLYGATRASARGLDVEGGVVYAGLLWLIGDELVVPLLGLQAGPTAASPIAHVNRLGAHVAYGLATSAVTQTLKHVM
jgi:hypothetical protein